VRSRSASPLRLLLLALALAAPGCADADEGAQGAEEAESDLTATQLAGAFEKLGFGHAQGEIHQLLLLPDRTFVMDLKGEFGCEVYAGYTCPSTWNDGRTGDTVVRGTWKATTKNVTLQPTGQGRPSAPIPMTVTLASGKATVEGTMVPNRRVFGTLDVVGLFGKPHTVKAEDLHGTWKATSPNDKDGFQPKVDGTNVYIGTEYEHVVTFRDAGTYVDDRVESGKASRRKKDDGRFWVAGAPDGSGAGVLLYEWGYVFSDTRLGGLAGTKLTLDFGEDRKLVLTKQP
jgi:hypothetical protein